MTPPANILAIDPGPAKCGYGEIAFSRARPNRIAFVACGHEATALTRARLAKHVMNNGFVAIEGCFWQPKMIFTASILATERVAGEFEGRCRQERDRWDPMFHDHEQPPEPICMLSTEWKRQLGLKSSAPNIAVHRALARAFLPDLPKVTNEHGRDALGLAVVASRVFYRGIR